MPPQTGTHLPPWPNLFASYWWEWRARSTPGQTGPPSPGTGPRPVPPGAQAPADGPRTGEAGDGHGQGTAELYHRALLAARAGEVQPETAAIASAVALDAQRISGELRGDPDVPPPGPFDWRSLFA